MPQKSPPISEFGKAECCFYLQAYGGVIFFGSVFFIKGKNEHRISLFQRVLISHYLSYNGYIKNEVILWKKSSKHVNHRYNHLILLYVIIAAYAIYGVYDSSHKDILVMNFIILAFIFLAVAFAAYIIFRKLGFFNRIGISDKGITMYISGKEPVCYSWDDIANVEKYKKSNKTKSKEYIKVTTNKPEEFIVEYLPELYDEVMLYR